MKRKRKEWPKEKCLSECMYRSNGRCTMYDPAKLKGLCALGVYSASRIAKLPEMERLVEEMERLMVDGEDLLADMRKACLQYD